MKASETAARLRSGAKSARPHVKGPTESFTDFDERPLHRCVENALNGYLAALDGEEPHGLYDLVMAEVERPMLECVMRHVTNNQSRAATLLGVSRGTLRKKLIQHGLLEQ